jgi:hypothetical protein
MHDGPLIKYHRVYLPHTGNQSYQTLMIGTEMISKTVSFDHLTLLMAQEDFQFNHHESFM